MKKGLVMEGGAMRGLFTAGVIDVFMENNIDFDGAIGVSAGAAFGCNIKSKQIGRALRYNTRYCKEWRYASFRSWFLTGDLYGGEFDYQLLPSKLDPWDTDTFAKNPMEFWCVATDIHTAEPLYHKCTDGGKEDLLWIQGSASMPIFSRPVHVDGKEIEDGGCSDSVPLKFFEEKGYDRNVVILTQPADYRKKPYDNKILLIMKTALHKYPLLYEELRDRWKAYNEEIASIVEQEKEGKVYVIRPEKSLNIGSVCHDPDELKRVYIEGRTCALKQLKQVREYLQ